MRLGEYPPAPQSPQDLTPASPAEPLEPDGVQAAAPDDPAYLALRALGFSKPLLASLCLKAEQHGTSLEDELLHSGLVTEKAYYGAMARFLRLPFVDRIDPDSVLDILNLDTQFQRPLQVSINYQYRPRQTAMVPEAATLADRAASLEVMPQLRQNLVVTTPSAIREAVWKAGAQRRVRHTVTALFDRTPDFSARTVMTGRQGFYAGLALAVLLSALVVAPFETLYILHVTLSLTFFASLLLRFAPIGLGSNAQIERYRQEPSGPLPRYTVMVALYHEAEVAAQLIESLRRIEWPRSLLDIKLVCEADDRETIDALRALRLEPHFEIVEVPDFGPRTKPKALTYALAAARGEFVAVYDAEDRPHPQQLREAYRHFRNVPKRIACLQAPLIISNARDSWISANFSMEYCALFRRLLPMLASLRLPLPLGGTSNHFRTEVLREVGGWDPFNVTEDADLGMRLYRLGYRSETLMRHTFEDAPVTAKVWIGQRSRWFKGWLQTWLVLMRAPQRLVREMGLGAFLIFQLMIGGMLMSSLLHPLIFLFIGMGIAAMLQAPTSELPLDAAVLFGIDLTNILGSYALFLALGMSTMTTTEKTRIGRRWRWLPIYWLMISGAAWRAVYELRFKPFYWNKTPHIPSRKPAD